VRVGPHLSYLGYRAGSAVVTAVPESWVGPGAKVVGRVAARTMRGRARMLTRHLRRVHGGDVPEPELDRLVAGAFESYGRYWLEAFRLPGRSLESIEQRFSIDGRDHIDAALAEGKGVILAMPHVGNWDLGGAWFCGAGYPVTVLAEALEPPKLGEWFFAFRRSLGMEVVSTGDGAARALIAALRANRAVAIVGDRDLSRSGVEVTFFGEETTLPEGPAMLALRTGATILPASVYFNGDGGHHAIVRPPLGTTRGDGPLRDDVARITQALAAEYEWFIRRAPEQWHLLQPNWPSDYEAGGRR
jgi:KDO2-lipid IV(A) lauroyltransferase